MDIEMVLNEISLKTPAIDIITARKYMSELIYTLRQATKIGVKRILRTSDNINTIKIAHDHPISRWRNDKEVDLEERRFFRSLITKAPLWHDIEETFKEKLDLSDIWYQKESAGGLGFAFIIDGLAISFQSEEKWNYSYLTLDITYLDDNDELIDKTIEVKHASNPNHVIQHQKWIKNRLQSDINNGLDLWNKRTDIFPNLEFCNCVEKQLIKSSITLQKQYFNKLKDALFILENYSKNWEEGSSFIIEGIDESGESEITLKKYSKERTFLCPDGKERIFEHHMKLKSFNWRIYFYPVKTKKIYVGYIGKHLPTVKYKS